LFRRGSAPLPVPFHRVPFAKDYRPPVAELPGEVPESKAGKPAKQTIMGPQFITDFGWKLYVEKLAADRSALIQLNSMPSGMMVALWPEGSEGRRIEEGLLVLYHFIVTYIQDANTRVNGSHKSLRKAIRPE
jgi:hypothetical protein